MLKTLVSVLRRPLYLLLAGIVAWLILSVSILFPNASLLWQIIGSNSMTLFAKIQFVMTFYGALVTNFSFFSATYTILISLLFAINVSLLVFYIRRQRAIFKGVGHISATGVGGIVAGFLGIGCAACGTFVLTSLLTLIGAGSILTVLPLKGQELGILAVGLLAYSVYALIKKINTPLVCE